LPDDDKSLEQSIKYIGKPIGQPFQSTSEYPSTPFTSIPSNQILISLNENDLKRVSFQFAVPFNDSDSKAQLIKNLKAFKRKEKQLRLPYKSSLELAQETALPESEGEEEEVPAQAQAPAAQAQAQAPAQAPAAQAPVRATNRTVSESTFKAYKPENMKQLFIDNGINTKGFNFKDRQDMLFKANKYGLIKQKSDKKSNKKSGKGFKPLSSFPPHIVGGLLRKHINRLIPKAINRNEYNRENAHKLLNSILKK